MNTQFDIKDVIIGNTYKWYDDGKITPSREYNATITKIVPFADASEYTLKLWAEALESDHLYSKTDYFIEAHTDEHEDYPHSVFAQTISGGFFSMGVVIEKDEKNEEWVSTWWNSGRLTLNQEPL